MAILDPQEIDQVLDRETPVFPTAEGDGPRLGRVGAGLVRDLRHRGVMPDGWVYASGTVLRDLVALVLSEDTASTDRREALEAALVIHAYATATLRAWLEGRRRERRLEGRAEDPQRREDHLHEDDEDASRVDRACEAMISCLRRLVDGAHADDTMRRRAHEAIFGMIAKRDLVAAAVKALAEATVARPVEAAPEQERPEAVTSAEEEEEEEVAFVLTWTKPGGPFMIVDNDDALDLRGLGLDSKTGEPFPTLKWFAWLVLSKMGRKVAPVLCPGHTTRFNFQGELKKALGVMIANASSNDTTQHSLVGDIRFDAATERVARAWIAGRGPRRS